MNSEFRTTRAFANEAGETVTEVAEPAEATESTKMSIEYLKPFAMNEEELNTDGTLNPFHQDLSNMGTRLASNVVVMHQNHDHEHADWLILVNTKTGERIKINF